MISHVPKSVGLSHCQLLCNRLCSSALLARSQIHLLRSLPFSYFFFLSFILSFSLYLSFPKFLPCLFSKSLVFCMSLFCFCSVFSLFSFFLALFVWVFSFYSLSLSHTLTLTHSLSLSRYLHLGCQLLALSTPAQAIAVLDGSPLNRAQPCREIPHVLPEPVI